MRPLAIVLSMLVVTVWLLSILVLQVGVYEPLVPSPERVVENFVKNMSARRFSAAQSQLSKQLTLRTPAKALAELDILVRGKYGRYALKTGSRQHYTVERAEHLVQVRTTKAGEVSWSFVLTRDPHSRLWGIDRLPPPFHF